MKSARILLISTALIASGFALSTADAQTPKRGGSATAGYESGDPANFDCHGTTGLNIMTFVAPHYSLLLRYDVNAYPKIEGDVAESWTVSPDGLTYTFKLRPNVKFHDGSTLTADDVKATYDRIRNPPQGVVSLRRTEFADVASVTVVDPLTIAFKLSQPNAAMLNSFASPFNCIYSAKRLAESPTYPLTNVMGTGPFVPTEYVKGSHWAGKRFDGYFKPGRPYLDNFRIAIISPASGPLAIQGGQIDMLLRTLQPSEVASINARMGDKARFTATSTLIVTMMAFNSSRKPFDDVRVRRALTMAIDRKGGLAGIMQLTNMATDGTITRPGGDWTLPASEVSQLPGFTGNIAAARTEARRLLAEAGQSNLRFRLLSRPTSPYNQLGIYAIDQWRQIGVTVENNPIDAAPYQTAMTNGEFDVVNDVNNTTAEDPSTLLSKYVPGAGSNFGKYQDQMLTDLYEQQKKTLNVGQRKQLVNSFEKRLLSQAYIMPLYWAGWTSVTASTVHGWQPTPIFFVGYDMGGIWRD